MLTRDHKLFSNICKKSYKKNLQLVVGIVVVAAVVAERLARVHAAVDIAGIVVEYVHEAVLQKQTIRNGNQTQ